jgi:hypothetical protein
MSGVVVFSQFVLTICRFLRAITFVWGLHRRTAPARGEADVWSINVEGTHSQVWRAIRKPSWARIAWYYIFLQLCSMQWRAGRQQCSSTHASLMILLWLMLSNCLANWFCFSQWLVMSCITSISCLRLHTWHFEEYDGEDCSWQTLQPCRRDMVLYRLNRHDLNDCPWIVGIWRRSDFLSQANRL